MVSSSCTAHIPNGPGVSVSVSGGTMICYLHSSVVTEGTTCDICLESGNPCFHQSNNVISRHLRLTSSVMERDLKHWMTVILLNDQMLSLTMTCCCELMSASHLICKV